MTKKNLISAAFSVVFFSLLVVAHIADAKPIQLILDTDISSDVDDVGAVAVLHALADRGEAEILAMMVSSGDPWSPGCLDAINTYFCRPDIPIGVVGENSVVHVSKYTQAIAQEYSNDVAEKATLPDVVDLYREILAASPDRSVVIVSIGYLTNLHRLLISRPDRNSPLDGVDLVKKKVIRWICMGGEYPAGREWNFFQDGKAARGAVAQWPGTIVFVGYEAGLDVLTGEGLAETEEGNPLRRSYRLYNDLTDRPSWDQLAVLYAVRGRPRIMDPLWEVVSGNNAVQKDGSNRWRPSPDGTHFYLRLRQRPKAMAAAIEALMISSLRSRPVSNP